MTVHLQGFGWTGSYLAWRLESEGIPFTWEDSDEAICAWKASTGSVYPCGEEEEQRAYEYWRQWKAPEQVRHAVCEAPYWYTSKGAPHAGKWDPVVDLGFIRRHPLPSLHVNVQQFVRATRREFRDRRRMMAAPGATVLVSHGFGDRLSSYVWGWSRRVRLDYDTRVFGDRACFYCRDGRYVLAYAYPVPGEPGLWYAGSSMISQKSAHSLDMESKYATWASQFERLMQGTVQVTSVGALTEGWRPKPVKGDERLVSQVGTSLAIRPMGASGVRMAPALAEAVLRRLK